MSEYEMGRLEGIQDRDYYIREFGQREDSVVLSDDSPHARGYRDGYLSDAPSVTADQRRAEVQRIIAAMRSV